jgi:hypothetical protein
MENKLWIVRDCSPRSGRILRALEAFPNITITVCNTHIMLRILISLIVAIVIINVNEI